jgi:hypothetical protein
MHYVRTQQLNVNFGGMNYMKKIWVSPDLQVLGDVQTLTQQVNGCEPPVMKGLTTADSFSQGNANPNNGCVDGASGF